MEDGYGIMRIIMMEGAKTEGAGSKRVELSASFWILVGALLLFGGVGLFGVAYGVVIAEVLNGALGWTSILSLERLAPRMFMEAGGGIFQLLPVAMIVVGALCVAKGVKMRKAEKIKLCDVGNGAEKTGADGAKNEADNAKCGADEAAEVEEDDEPSPLKLEEMRDLQKVKLKRMSVLCGLTGLGVVLCVTTVVLLIAFGGKDVALQAFIYGLLGFALFVIPWSLAVGILTIVQLKTTKAYGVEISWGRATLLAFSLIACLLPIAVAGIVIMIVPMF